MTTPATPWEAPTNPGASRPARTEAIGRCRDLLERRPELRQLRTAGVVLAEGAGSA